MNIKIAANQNVNDLAGMSCPAGGSSGPFVITGTNQATTDGDVADHSSVQDRGHKHCHCVDCEYGGTVGEFGEEVGCEHNAPVGEHGTKDCP